MWLEDPPVELTEAEKEKAREEELTLSEAREALINLTRGEIPNAISFSFEKFFK